jgi:hypothetical protein
MTNFAQIFGYTICLLVGGFGLTIIAYIWMGKINLSALLSEANGQASMSRFQLLIFTFVIAIGLFELLDASQSFPNIPSGVLGLLGISAGTYVVGKGISFSKPEGLLNQGTGSDGNTPPTNNNPSTQASTQK